jgi:hypothetical protein
VTTGDRYRSPPHQITVPNHITSTTNSKTSKLHNTIVRMATQLMRTLSQHIERVSAHNSIAQALDQIPQTRTAQPTLSYAAVTIMGLNTEGVIISKPEPTRRIIMSMQDQNRQRIPNPIQGTARILISHSLNTLLSRENRRDLLSEALIDLVSLARKPSTFKKHTGYFMTWVKYAQLNRNRILPISPIEFANYLIEAASKDKTVSPTLSRCDSVSFFCELSNTVNPMEHSLCRMIKEALTRKLGIRGKKKLPLLHEQLSAIFTRQLGNSHTLHTVVTCFRIALMYEGCLRWHDLARDRMPFSTRTSR